MHVLAHPMTAQAMQALTHTDCNHCSSWLLHQWEAARISSGPALATVFSLPKLWNKCLTCYPGSCHFKWLLLKPHKTLPGIFTSPLAHDLPSLYPSSTAKHHLPKREFRGAQDLAMFSTAKWLKQSRDAHCQVREGRSNKPSELRVGGHRTTLLHSNFLGVPKQISKWYSVRVRE